MGNSKLKGKDLQKINIKSDQLKSLAIEIMHKDFKHHSKDEKLVILESVLLHPKRYLKHEYLSKLAIELVEKPPEEKGTAFMLDSPPKDYKVYGRKNISDNTVSQMDTALQLPITRFGALMPDAHVGYGLPIGGVLACKDAVIPYGVGLDIGCRMALSIFDASADFIERYNYQIKTSIKQCTHFGIGSIAKHQLEHEVLDREEFGATKLLQQLHGKAQNQLGSSGTGNHFVEMGTVELFENNEVKLPAGKYVGILTHSGSRGLGASIARHYTQIAMETCLLPKGAQQLAWLDMNTQAGQEYWLSMNLAGDYAKACHDTIHQRLAKSLGLKPITKVENHHNFAWKETLNNEEFIVHRKGATPAQENQLGIIPANMVDAGYIVSGKGNSSSLNSASHGAGRKLSRKSAKNSITGSVLNKLTKQKKISVIGGSTEEAPMAYKNIEEVMNSQQDLVKIEGKFQPQIVRMHKQ